MLRVDFSTLGEGHHEQVLHPTADNLEVDPEVFNDLALDLRLDVFEHRIVASFDVRAIATLECDRTLVRYQHPVAGSHAVVFIAPDQYSADSKDDSLQPLPELGTELDLTAAVRDTLVLSLPLRRVSPEAEEAEIPLTYGNQQTLDGVPIDDRWDALRGLRRDVSD